MNEKNELVFNFKKNEVRTITNNNEVWFCLKDVCDILELSHPSKVKERLNQKGVNSIPTLTNGGMQNMIYIDESNLYKVIFQSRKPQAEEFTEWVTSEVLPTIRKTGSYHIPSNPMEALELMFEAQKQSNEKLDQLDQRITNVENTTTIVSSQQLILKKIASSTAIHVLGGKDTVAYKNLSKRVFRTMWRDYQNYFNVTSYRDTLKTDYEKARRYLKNWRPDTNLRYEIDMYGFDF